MTPGPPVFVPARCAALRSAPRSARNPHNFLVDHGGPTCRAELSHVARADGLTYFLDLAWSFLCAHDARGWRGLLLILTNQSEIELNLMCDFRLS
jgi:hypothetical protein